MPVAGRLTQGAITEMHAVSRSIGARFVVMFVPFKSQVYLPLLEDALPKDDLRSALSYYLESFGRPVDLDRLYANRLAQNRLMQQFCAKAGAAFLGGGSGQRSNRPAVMRILVAEDDTVIADSGKFGMAVEPLTPQLADRLELGRDVEGVVITNVDPSGAAASAGLREGDVIQQTVRSTEQVRSGLDAASDKPVVLLVARSNGSFFVPLRTPRG